MTPADVTAATAEPLGKIGAAFYFRPETVEVGKQHGLGGFRFYLAGRGGVLGNVDSSVVHSAFGYFNPDLVEKLWATSVEIAEPRTIARWYIECAHQTGRDLFGDIDEAVLSAFVDTATAVITGVDDAALALFAGVRAEPVPTDDVRAAAYHQAMVLRELRGSIHLAALSSVGVNSRVAHQIKRPDDLEMFGWSESVEITDQDRARWEQAEALTNDRMTDCYGVLDAQPADQFVEGVEAMFGALG